MLQPTLTCVTSGRWAKILIRVRVRGGVFFVLFDRHDFANQEETLPSCIDTDQVPKSLFFPLSSRLAQESGICTGGAANRAGLHECSDFTLLSAPALLRLFFLDAAVVEFGCFSSQSRRRYP